MKTTDRGVRTRNKEETRRRIFEAAASAFAESGYSAATLDRIAEEAGCSKALVIRYFGTKQDLYRTVVNSRYAELSQRETIHGLAEADTVVELLRGILSDLFAFNREHPSFARLIAWENLNGAAHLDPETARAARGPGWARLRAILEDAKKRGMVRKDVDVARLVYALQAITVVYFSNRHTMKILTGFSFESPDTMKGFVDFYARLLGQGIAADGGTRA
ncbi:MAG: TetR/AcrR family transcriptional regulator [Candidatus Bipolaricaulis sp.]|nr:TetR/AcrR family transcriptional regulator [Candidatus Bipolaricaulis sp.]